MIPVIQKYDDDFIKDWNRAIAMFFRFHLEIPIPLDPEQTKNYLLDNEFRVTYTEYFVQRNPIALSTVLRIKRDKDLASQAICMPILQDLILEIKPDTYEEAASPQESLGYFLLEEGQFEDFVRRYEEAKMNPEDKKKQEQSTEWAAHLDHNGYGVIPAGVSWDSKDFDLLTELRGLKESAMGGTRSFFLTRGQADLFKKILEEKEGTPYDDQMLKQWIVREGAVRSEEDIRISENYNAMQAEKVAVDMLYTPATHYSDLTMKQTPPAKVKFYSGKSEKARKKDKAAKKARKANRR